MIKSIELNREFSSKSELFAALKKNEANIISLKKAAIQKSHDKGQFTPSYIKVDETSKAILNLKDGYIYPVINTTKYLDSHGDVHLDGIWTKSIKDNSGKFFYVNDHSLKTSDVIAWSDDVKAYTKNLAWSFIGKDYEGETQALIFEIELAKIVNDAALKVINDKRPVQNSVRMQYVDIHLAMDSDNKEHKENKKLYDKVYPTIANKDRADENGYFWAVGEAKIQKEGSMVLLGSNDATPIIYQEPVKSTPVEPLGGTHKSNILLNFLT